jgi:hypothetical protein
LKGGQTFLLASLSNIQNNFQKEKKYAYVFRPPRNDCDGTNARPFCLWWSACRTQKKPAAEEAPSEEPLLKPFVFGMLLVGPYNDNGWSQAHYEAGLYVEEKLGAKMIYLDKVNPADRPGTTPDQLAEELVAQGAKLVIFNSDDMKDASTAFAKANPDVYVIMASGDQVWEDGRFTNRSLTS